MPRIWSQLTLAHNALIWFGKILYLIFKLAIAFRQSFYDHVGSFRHIQTCGACRKQTFTDLESVLGHDTPHASRWAWRNAAVHPGSRPLSIPRRINHRPAVGAKLRRSLTHGHRLATLIKIRPASPERPLPAHNLIQGLSVSPSGGQRAGGTLESTSCAGGRLGGRRPLFVRVPVSKEIFTSQHSFHPMDTEEAAGLLLSGVLIAVVGVVGCVLL